MEKITLDFIINILREKVENKTAQFDSNFFIETAAKLNLLLGDEMDKLAELHQKVAQLKLMFLESQDKKINVSEAKVRVEASNEFLEWKKQDLKCRRAEEFIRIEKKMSDVASGYA